MEENLNQREPNVPASDQQPESTASGNGKGPDFKKGLQIAKTGWEKFNGFMNSLSRPFDFLFDLFERYTYEKQTNLVLSYIEKSVFIIIVLAGICFIISMLASKGDISDPERLVPFWLAMIPVVSTIVKTAMSITSMVVFMVQYAYSVNPVLAVIVSLIVVIMSAVIAPKALLLARSVVNKDSTLPIRPELLYVLKLLIITAYLLLIFVNFRLILLLPVVIILLSLLSQPKLVGIKADYPENAVIEIRAFLIMLLNILMFLLSPVVVIAAALCLVFAIFGERNSGLYPVAILAPVLFPLVLYFFYIIYTFLLDLFGAICSVPSKLDGIRETIQDKGKKE